MADHDPDVLHFLFTRRSRPVKTLTAPVPDHDEITRLLTAAARVPDHGKLEPWRFIVLSRAALEEIAEIAARHAANAGLDEAGIAKARRQFDESPLAVAVIETQKPSETIPAIEQSYSAGAACLSLVNAALASGWGASWLSGALSHTRAFAEEALGLDPHERIAGFIHIGTGKSTPPERPRPDMTRIITWR